MGIPKDALCFIRDGSQWCCFWGDSVNLQESNAGFGDTQDLASLALRKVEPRMYPVYEQPLTQAEFMKEFGEGVKKGVEQAIGTDGLSGFSMGRVK